MPIALKAIRRGRGIIISRDPRWPQIKAEILRCRGAGWSLNRIMEKYPIGYELLRKICQQAGFPAQINRKPEKRMARGDLEMALRTVIGEMRQLEARTPGERLTPEDYARRLAYGCYPVETIIEAMELRARIEAESQLQSA